jgi:hypothetical protein
MNGVILIALGHPMYSHYAYNLALSIKYTSPQTPITVVKGGGGFNQLFDWQQSIFDNIIDFDMSLIFDNGQYHYLKAKTLIYDLSPYNKTIYLDVDMIWSPYKNINDLFNQHSGLVFAVRGEGVSEWIDKELLYVTYGIDHWYDLSSEFILFDKSKENKKFFADAAKYYSDDKIPVVSGRDKKEGLKGITMFANSKPDELPFGIAIEKNGIKLKCPYTPIYWQPHFFTKRLNDVVIQKEYYGLSLGGNNISSNTQRIYNNLAKYYYYKMGIKKVPYQAVSKSKILPERKLI